MEIQSWWKKGVAVVFVLLALAVAWVLVPSGGPNVSATEPASPLQQEDGSQAIFVKYDGIDGEATDSKHDKWTDVLSIDWGSLRRFVRDSSGKTGSASVDPIVLTFAYEKASPALAEALLSGSVIPKVEIELTTTFFGSRATYLKYELTNVMVTSYRISGIEGGLPTVDVGNNFEVIKVTYTEFDEAGSEKGDVGYEYDAIGKIIVK